MCAQLSGTLTEPAFPRPDCPCMGARSQWIRVTASFCYYDTETGGASLFAPEGSSPSFIYDQGDFSQPIYIGEPPPSLPVKANIGVPVNTGWFAQVRRCHRQRAAGAWTNRTRPCGPLDLPPKRVWVRVLSEPHHPRHTVVSS